MHAPADPPIPRAHRRRRRFALPVAAALTVGCLAVAVGGPPRSTWAASGPVRTAATVPSPDSVSALGGAPTLGDLSGRILDQPVVGLSLIHI